jgi:uncharacterized integral membrane protein (TIGR00698 family)
MKNQNHFKHQKNAPKHPPHFNWLYMAVIAACFSSYLTPALALLIGFVFSLLRIRRHPVHKYTSNILQVSIVLMGFGMNLGAVVSATKSGFFETAVSVSSVMLMGILLGKLLKVEKNIALLISSGTAICGGSAIAAIAPILKSKSDQNTFALIVVFVLNAVALFLFPFIGHRFGLDQVTFGNWAAIAIHDTSSVVGAGAIYGEQALQVATTVKLIRALWLIPLSLIIAFFSRKDKSEIKIPWFIFLFITAILFAHFFPAYQMAYNYLGRLSKCGMLIALFLIGSNISLLEIKQSGAKSFGHGFLLWTITAFVSLLLLI